MQNLNTIFSADAYIRTAAEEREWNEQAKENRRREIKKAQVAYLHALADLLKAAERLEEEHFDLDVTAQEISDHYDGCQWEWDLPEKLSDCDKLVEGL